MSQLTVPAEKQKGSWIAVLALVIAATSLLIVALDYTAHNDGPTTATVAPEPSRWERIKKSGVIRVGYGGFPPYTIINVNESDPSKRVTGLSVDLVNDIAKRHSPPLKVEWHLFSWDAMKADLATDKFDFIADPVFQTVPRASDFSFTIPYSYFGIATAVVRKDDNRFKKFSDLDTEGVVIALAEGWTSSEYARAHLSNPTFRSIPVTGDAFTQLDEVLAGRADVALNDVPTVLQYSRAHTDTVKALWLKSPPSTVPGGFLVRSNDYQLQHFLDTAIRIVIADGTLKEIDRKWNSYGFIPDVLTEPGAGLQEP